MELFTEATSETELDMGQVHRFGQTELVMKANGAITKQTALANSGMRTEMFMKVSGKMIRQMDTEFTCMSMVLGTKVNGKMTCKMAKASNRGVMAQNIEEGTKRA